MAIEIMDFPIKKIPFSIAMQQITRGYCDLRKDNVQLSSVTIATG